MSDEALRDLERRWQESGSVLDEVAYRVAWARSHLGDGHAAELIRLLEHDDVTARGAALSLFEGVRPEDMTWELLYAAGKCLEAEETHRVASEVFLRLADGGVDLKAPVQVCVQSLRWGEEGVRRRCTAFLREVAAGLRSDRGWHRVDLSPYASGLIDAIAEHDPGPTAEVAADLVLLDAEVNAEMVSTSLYIRWTECGGPVFDRLVEGLNAIDPSIVEGARRESPEKSPVSVDSVLAEVAERPGPFLLAEGQYSPQPSVSIRIGILEAGEVRADRWIAPADLERLAARLRERADVRTGEWDVMYATGWSYAWATDGGPVDVWDRAGHLVWQDGDALFTRDGGRCEVAAIKAVEAYLEEGWTVRGVRLQLEGGALMPVAEETDAMAALDPTYDGISLMCEASWVTSLAHSLVSALGVAYVKAEAL